MTNLEQRDVLTPEKGRQLLDWSTNWLDLNVTVKRAPYVKAITNLWATIGDGAKTMAIFKALVLEATTFEKSEDWLLCEIRFEAQAHAIGNRESYALLSLECQDSLNDDVLDAYNQRISRSF